MAQCSTTSVECFAVFFICRWGFHTHFVVLSYTMHRHPTRMYFQHIQDSHVCGIMHVCKMLLLQKKIQRFFNATQKKNMHRRNTTNETVFNATCKPKTRLHSIIMSGITILLSIHSNIVCLRPQYLYTCTYYCVTIYCIQ